jgi:hypothetical protein
LLRANAPPAPLFRPVDTQGSQVSSHAVVTRELAFLRNLDLALLVLALPVFIAADLPLGGWGAAAGAWLAQRGIAALVQRRAEATDDLRTVAGLMTASMLARGWLVALTIFLVGLAEREAGLAAAVLSLALVTVYFSMRMATR